MPGLHPVDTLIRKDAALRHLWQVTKGGENAEAYWSPTASARAPAPQRGRGHRLRRIFVTDRDRRLTQVSDGRGTTTRSYSRRATAIRPTREHGGLPAKVDWSQGYWAVWPEHDI
jgi:hypothetical protein